MGLDDAGWYFRDRFVAQNTRLFQRLPARRKTARPAFWSYHLGVGAAVASVETWKNMHKKVTIS
ncbi:hypothetical protein [Corynebacterium pseudotuberculosis]|uniref:hypothetical protein n=1 Tax=Corynebacterium pseudotuberculosis TaxID=1719 RepID=UPI002B468156|nr:hypothetical protein [Corynebacterium pseudotuberculosis]